MCMCVFVHLCLFCGGLEGDVRVCVTLRASKTQGHIERY